MNASITDPSMQPVCQNCTTSTTPLWRRDELGSVLCNACGLFLKLHGRPRPISLKTDVIKSRNRVKSNGQGPRKKTSFDPNSLDPTQQPNGAPQPTFTHRRTSQMSTNGHSDGSNSPISRTVTPSIYGHMPAFSGGLLDESQFTNPNASITPMHLRQPSPGRSASPLNGGLDVPQTYEQLIAQNSSLKTRVSELEVINELFRGRVTQLEQDESNAKRGEEMHRESEQGLRIRLEESQEQANDLKRQVEELQRELSDLRGDQPQAKRARLSDGTGSHFSGCVTPSSAI